jgi:DNA modification methylase
MKPYYQDDHATIYNADARELVPQLEFDVVVTDPPYGMSVVNKNNKISNVTGTNKPKEYKPVIGDDKPLDPTWLAQFGKRQIIFGVSHFVNIPHAGRLLVWDKEVTNGIFAEVEVAWDSKKGPSKIIKHQQQGYYCNLGDIGRHHPTQKPLSVMLWILDNCTEPEQTIIDPYMGSGTTLRAAKDLNRKSIGIEIDEQYCEIAARRLAQEVLLL